MKNLNKIIFNFRENDASALINYAEALKLYQELDNKKGEGIIYNNIGNIHMKHHRFRESIGSYVRAIESNKFIKINNESFFKK